MKIFPILILLVLAGCSTSTKKTSEPVEEPKIDGYVVKKDTGIVVSAEDIGYPMFAIDLKSNATGKVTPYLLNLEACDVKHHEANEYLNHEARITYIIKKDPFVMDIVFADSSILGEYTPANHKGFQSITGLITGATEPSQGDLPGRFTVTSTDSIALSFEYYIDDKLAEINNQNATVYYEYREVYEIKSVDADR